MDDATGVIILRFRLAAGTSAVWECCLSFASASASQSHRVCNTHATRYVQEPAGCCCNGINSFGKISFIQWTTRLGTRSVNKMMVGRWAEVERSLSKRWSQKSRYAAHKLGDRIVSVGFAYRLVTLFHNCVKRISSNSYITY